MYSTKTLFKKAFLLLLLMVMFMPWAAKAQETLTVYDGTNSTLTTNSQVPMYGNYFDDYTKSEFVIPAIQLTEMESAEISALKFYISSVGSYGSGWSGTHQVVFLKEVESASLSAFSGTDGATVVFEGTFEEPASNATEYEIAFTTNYEYQGGNLLIGIYNTDDGGYRNVTWYGETVNGASGAGSNSSNLDNVSFSQKNFLPKTTFTYEPASTGGCTRPKQFNASNITAHTATLTWTAGTDGQSNWDVYVTTLSTDVPDDNTEPSYQVTECSKTLTGLTGETTYYAYVRSVCGGTDGNSTWAKKVFTTTVACPVPTLTVLVDTRTAYSVDLQWTGNAAADQFEVAYSTTSNFDPNGTELNGVYHRTIEVTPASSHTWTLDGLNPETTYRMRVRANCGSDDGSSSWSDQKSVTTLPTCVAPSSLSATATATSVTLNWTAGATGQDAWDIRYKTGSEDYTYIHIDNQTETSYTIPNLSPATTYSVNVRAYCDAEDQSKWGYSTNQNYDLSVTTECAAITLPYTCDFEGAVETGGHFSTYSVPKCWDRVELQYGSYPPYTYYPYVYDYSSDAHGGTKSLRMLKNSNSANETIILPEVDGQYDMSSLQIRFWAKTNSTNQTLQVGVMEGTTFVQVDEVIVANSTYTEYTVYFDGYNGTGRNIVIKCGSYQYMIYYYIDDLTVEVVPTCRRPKNLEAAVNSDSQATLTWIAGKDETAWNVQYKIASDNNWSEPISVEETSFTLTGLQRATTYEARVQANCAEDDQSDWTDAISFTTECGIWTVDGSNAIFEDFENVDASDFPPVCWEKFSYGMSGYTYWYLNSNNDLGSSAAFSYWNEGYAFLVMPKMHINGDAKLSFDHLIGSGTYNESCSVVVSTSGRTYNDFSTMVWEGNGPTSGKASVTVSLSAFDGQDIFVAFKFKGSGTSGCTWYVDNVQVYVGEVFTKEISAYNGDGGYYLIASPVVEVSPENVLNMCENSYDLYAFDQAQDLEWRNYEAGSFNLEAGKGYLYANSQDVALKFMGTPYTGSGEITLTKAANTEFSGWNLIGNPFATAATLNKPYYRLNTNGNALKTETESSAVDIMEGVFVQATEAAQSATFTALTRDSKQASIAQANIVVSSDNGNILDNAIIRFDNGESLEKFSFREGGTKVYFPIDGKDYAIVNAENQNELPVNFKAAENGTYTLSVNTENIEVNHLHLVDNLTGTDVDLLAQNGGNAKHCVSTYTFKAKTTDYASRFKLVFTANSEYGSSTGSETFGFVNAMGNFCIFGIEGNATLQVIDNMGRILSSEQFSDSYERSLNVAPGVYMLRLINSDNVRVQKVIIK